jgi:hypothetical protein
MKNVASVVPNTPNLGNRGIEGFRPFERIIHTRANRGSDDPGERVIQHGREEYPEDDRYRLAKSCRQSEDEQLRLIA